MIFLTDCNALIYLPTHHPSSISISISIPSPIKVHTPPKTHPIHPSIHLHLHPASHQPSIIMAPSNTNRPMPPTALMLRTHTLAHEIVTRDKNAVFDDEYLDLLERFVRDPSESNKQEMLAEFGWGDDGGSRPGMCALVSFNRFRVGEIINPE